MTTPKWIFKYKYDSKKKKKKKLIHQQKRNFKFKIILLNLFLTFNNIFIIKPKKF